MASIILLIYLTALDYKVDPYLALAVAIQESELKPTAVGKLDDYGLFQIREKFVGFKKKQLFNPQLNTKLGMIALRKAENNCHYNKKKSWLTCYNRGIAGAKKVENPYETAYYKRIMHTYNCIKRYKYIETFYKKDLVKECK